jgi:hypothetical protein
MTTQTTLRTEDDVRRWLEGHDEDEHVDDDDVRTAWRVVMGREPDDDDEALPGGLHSHLCAAVQ